MPNQPDLTHGRLFDQFSANASHTHGGSYFDAGFGMQTVSDAHGKLYDLFGVPRTTDAEHGARFDEFGWESMPALHGQLFDSDFRQESAHDGSNRHATWFDAFRGGTQVRCMVDGADYEGTVIDCNREFATVRGHDGQTHEVGLSQFLAYRTPNDQQASPPLPATDSKNPSAHNTKAHGSYHGERDEPTPGPIVQPVHPGAEDAGNRHGMPAGLMDTFTHLKSLADELDVEKAIPEHMLAGGGGLIHVHHAETGKHLGAVEFGRSANTASIAHIGPSRTFTSHPTGALHHIIDHHGLSADQVHVAHSGGDPMPIGRSHFFGKSVEKVEHSVLTEGKPTKCLNCGTGLKPKKEQVVRDGAAAWVHTATCPACRTEHVSVAKDVDSTETAVQSQDLEGGGGKAWCPHCKHDCKKPTKEGTCPTCGSKVTVGKVASDGSEVPHRGHKSTDHHSKQVSAPGRCPHCGGILELLDEKTEQGQPNRKHKTGAGATFDTVSHKCAGTGVDVLKNLLEA